ncbi:MAG: hypothetical protein ABIL18_08705, partial [candidate division WOR-3 bacterium]
ELKNAWFEYESMKVFEILNLRDWDLWVSLTSYNWIHPRGLWSRFFWWIKGFRRMVDHRIDYFFVIAPQKRGVMHLHGVIDNVSECVDVNDKEIRMRMRDLWDVCWKKLPNKKENPGERRFNLEILRAYREDKSLSFDWVKDFWFGSSRILIFNNKYAGRLKEYLTKEFVKNMMSVNYYKLSEDYPRFQLSWRLRKELFKVRGVYDQGKKTIAESRSPYTGPSSFLNLPEPNKLGSGHSKSIRCQVRLTTPEPDGVSKAEKSGQDNTLP